MKLTAITVIDDGKSQIQPGTTFDRPKKQALQLIDCGAAAAIVSLKVVEPDQNPDTGSSENPDPDPDTESNENPDQNSDEGTDDSPEEDLEDDPANPDANNRDPLTGLPTS